MTSDKFSKVKKKQIVILLIIIFFHVFSVIVSAFYDQAMKRGRQDFRRNDGNFGLGFFTWWSAWASLLTVPWAIYKLLVQKRKKNTYSEQLNDMMIVETNLLSGIIFCCGGFLLTIPTRHHLSHSTITLPLFGSIKTINVGVFYNLFGHILAPGLVFYYFGKYCRVAKLAKKKSRSLIINLFNPTFYLLFLLLRPKISNFSGKLYPYSPFFGIMGKYANKSERELGKNQFLGGSGQPSGISGLIGLAITIIFWYIIFSLLLHFLVKLKSTQKTKSPIKCIM